MPWLALCRDHTHRQRPKLADKEVDVGRAVNGSCVLDADLNPAHGVVEFATARVNPFDAKVGPWWNLLPKPRAEVGTPLATWTEGCVRVGFPQAEATCKTARLDAGDFPPVLDVETPGEGARSLARWSAKTWLAEVMIAPDILATHFGTSPIVYASARVWKEDLKNWAAPGLRGCPL